MERKAKNLAEAKTLFEESEEPVTCFKEVAGTGGAETSLTATSLTDAKAFYAT